jgi:oxygen-independent coproporphyrinogen-3 oxidase
MDIGLYVHVPFCDSKCCYCDFYSVVPRAGQVVPLIEAICVDLARIHSRERYRVATVFVGGGTPSALAPAVLTRLMGALGDWIGTDRPSEFTVEANPASLTTEKATILRGHGVNRLSMGAQSFHADELRWLGRLHGPEDIAATARIVKAAGFERWSLDLIFGVPGQTPVRWRESLERAVALDPDHIACYGLTYEPGTPLHARLAAGQVEAMDEGLEAELYSMTAEFLPTAGYQQYETSNYAREGARCLHNVRYWKNEPGLGVGPSAVSYIDGRRWRKVADVAEYVRRVQEGADPTSEEETLSEWERAGETAMLNLRMNEGIDACEFLRRTGLDPRLLFAEAIDRHVRAGLLAVEGNRITLTPAGRLVADRVQADYLNPTPPVAGTRE